MLRTERAEPGRGRVARRLGPGRPRVVVEAQETDGFAVGCVFSNFRADGPEAPRAGRAVLSSRGPLDGEEAAALAETQ